MSLSPTIRRRLRCRGVVQGVGFRPAVYRLAVDHGLGGFVRNDADGVTIEVEGAARAVTDFEAQLQGALPPRARLVELTVEDAACDGHRDFVVADSAFISSISASIRSTRSCIRVTIAFTSVKARRNLPVPSGLACPLRQTAKAMPSRMKAIIAHSKVLEWFISVCL